MVPSRGPVFELPINLGPQTSPVSNGESFEKSVAWGATLTVARTLGRPVLERPCPARCAVARGPANAGADPRAGSRLRARSPLAEARRAGTRQRTLHGELVPRYSGAC